MSDVTRLAQVGAGKDANVDLTSSTLVTLSVKYGGGVSNTELTKAILDNLVNLQNGTDFSTGTNSHTHDGRYYTKTLLNATTNGASGASLIGIDVTPPFSNFTPTANTVQGALEGIDAALSSATGAASYTSDPTSISGTGFEAKDSGAVAHFLAGFVNGTHFSSWDGLADNTALFMGNKITSAVAVMSMPAPTGDTTNSTGDAHLSSGAVIDVASTGNSGYIGIWSGTNLGLGATGPVFLQSGPISNTGNSANTGSTQVTTGDSNGTGNTGNLDLNTGSQTGSAGNSGNIVASTGTSANGTRGNIQLSGKNLQITTNDNNIAVNSSKISGLAAGTTAGDAVRYEQVILITGVNAFTANQPMGSHKLTGLSAGTTAGDSVRYEQAILTSGANAFGADQSMGGFKLTNLADPVSGTDAVNVNYLSARLAGLKPKQAVRAATTTNGTLATAFANGSVIDGVTLATNDRILLKDQSTASQNGIYTVNASGSPTRATDFDSVSPIDEINGAWVAVQEGTANAGKVYVQFGTVTTIGTDAINFEYFNPIASLIGGDMITFSGSTFSVDLATASGLESTNPGNAAGQLRIKLEASNPSLKFTGSNELAVKFDPAGALASGSAGVAVQVDNSTIDISGNQLEVKAGGITNTQVSASAAIAYSKLNLTGSIVNADINASAAIAYSKLNLSNSIVAGDLTSNSVTAAKVNTNVFDQSTITGGGGSAAVVQNAPVVSLTVTAGEAFAANTSFAVRWGLPQNGETAGRVYKADKTTSSFDLFYVVGMVMSAAGVSAGGTLTMTKLGLFTLGSSDTAFNTNDQGKPVFSTSSGAFSVTAPNGAGDGFTRIGIVKTTTTIDLNPGQSMVA